MSNKDQFVKIKCHNGKMAFSESETKDINFDNAKKEVEIEVGPISQNFADSLTEYLTECYLLMIWDPTKKEYTTYYCTLNYNSSSIFANGNGHEALIRLLVDSAPGHNSKNNSRTKNCLKDIKKALQYNKALKNKFDELLERYSIDLEEGD